MNLIYKGKATVRIAHQTFSVQTGDILIYPEGVAHEENVDPDDPLQTIYLGWEGPTENWAYLVHDIEGRIRLLAEWLCEQELQGGRENSIVHEPFLKAILAEFSRLCQHTTENRLVASLRAFMRDHLAEPLTLDDLADHAGMSKFHFVRLYKQLSGHTPMQDLQFIRAQTARDLIITTNLPLKTVASKVGLTDAAHLSRVFHKFMDATPAYFRRDSKA